MNGCRVLINQTEKGAGNTSYSFPCLKMKFNIIMIGCGGTGGCLFGRFIRFLADSYLPDTEISYSIVDGDHVELKNLGRQPFVTEDIGCNKAVSLATAAEETLGVHVNAYPEYMSEKNYLGLVRHFDIYGYQTVNILIGAVDNHACRKLMHDIFINHMGTNCCFYIDAAKEYSSGDVVFAKKQNQEIQAPDRCHYYPEVLTDQEKPVYEKSCEELNLSSPQHLATNSLAADIIFSYLTQIITAGAAATLAPGGIAYFDAFHFFSRFDPYNEARYGKIG